MISVTPGVQQLDLGDNHFVYRVSGSGPDLLLLHGWISSGRMWAGTMEHFASQYRVWALDLMGFGDSRTADPTRILTVRDQARLVNTFCKVAGIRPYAIVGHSMGGAITLQLALDHADLFDKMVLVCPVVSGKLGWNMHSFVETMFGRTMLTVGQRLWATVRRLPRLSEFVAPAYLPRDILRRAVEDLQKATWGAAFGGVLSMANIGLDRRLTEIHKPTLVLVGALDLAVPPTEGRGAAAGIDGARLIQIETSHHQLPDEVPVQFHQALGEFLQQETLASTELPNAT